jgi:hypothetical protein
MQLINSIVLKGKKKLAACLKVAFKFHAEYPCWNQICFIYLEILVCVRLFDYSSITYSLQRC